MRIHRSARVAWVVLALIPLLSCVSSPEEKSARFIDAGKKLLSRNDPARATLEFQNAVKITPKNAEARYQLALAYLAAGSLTNGVNQLRTAIALDSKHTRAKLKLAELETLTADDNLVKHADQSLQLVLAENPNDPDVLHALALTELRMDEPNAAILHLEKALLAAPKEVAIAISLAEAKLRQKDVSGAEDVLRKACQTSPDSAECPVVLGRIYRMEGRLPDTEQQFRQALKVDSKSAPALLNLATLLAATHREQEAEQTLKKLSALPDKTFNFYHASYLFQVGKKDEALKEFDRLAKADPSDRAARSRLVSAYWAAGRVAEAQKTLDYALSKNRNDIDALLQRGEANLRLGKYVEAEADLNRVLHLKPDSAQVHYLMARLQAARGLPLLQRQELAEALRLNPFLSDVRVELAKELVAEDSRNAAVDVLDETPPSQRKLISIIEERNWALLAANRFSEARKGIDEGLANSRTSDLLLADAYLKIRDRQFDQARKSIWEAIGKSPEDLRALRFLVSSYSYQSQLANGVKAVKDYAAQHPQSAPIQFFLGSLLHVSGDNAGATQALLAARTANPEFAPTDLALAQVDLTQAKWDDARAPLSRILFNREDPTARKWLAMMEVSVGNKAAAITDFKKAIELQPNDSTSLNNLAYLLIEGGGQANSDDALRYAQKAVELAPDNADFQDTLGWVLYNRGLYDGAVTHIKTAITKNDGARFEYHLAMAYLKAGDSSRGDAALKTALHKDPKLPEAQVATQMLRDAQTK